MRGRHRGAGEEHHSEELRMVKKITMNGVFTPLLYTKRVSCHGIVLQDLEAARITAEGSSVRPPIARSQRAGADAATLTKAVTTTTAKLSKTSPWSFQFMLEAAGSSINTCPLPRTLHPPFIPSQSVTPLSKAHAPAQHNTQQHTITPSFSFCYFCFFLAAVN